MISSNNDSTILISIYWTSWLIINVFKNTLYIFSIYLNYHLKISHCRFWRYHSKTRYNHETIVINYLKFRTHCKFKHSTSRFSPPNVNSSWFLRTSNNLRNKYEYMNVYINMNILYEYKYEYQLINFCNFVILFALTILVLFFHIQYCLALVLSSMSLRL